MNEHPFLQAIQRADLVARTGRVVRILPTFVEASGPSVSIGSICEIETQPTASRPRPEPTFAEVVGVNRTSVTLAPFEEAAPTFAGAKVTARGEADTVAVGDAFLGRAIDALGRPLDRLGPIRSSLFGDIEGRLTAPLARTTPKRRLDTGVRAIDALLTLGEGQRVGVFAAAGVGKTSLMTQLARQVQADRCVICLVGERGREVEAFWSSDLPAEARSRTTLIAATSDQSAAMRVRACKYALALAEHWRAEGHHVLLLLDSVTRMAMALREIGLAAGEPPTVRAYTPSVFAALPRIVERCGAIKAGGAITAIMTVLSETDDVDDPISEAMRSLLDGHIVLSRSLAEQGHFPAIDVPRSVSRLADGLLDSLSRARAVEATALLSAYESSRTLIESGVYAAGGNPTIDRALDRRPALQAFLQQGKEENSGVMQSSQALSAALGAREAS